MNPTVRHTITVGLLVLPFAPTGAGAQEPRRVTLEEALDLFARNNLELGIARAEAAEAAALARQSAAYPNPTVTGIHEPLSDGDRTSSESYLNLSQRLEWPGTRTSRRDHADALAVAARGRLAGDSARLAFEVKAAWVQAARAEREERVLDRVTGVFRQGEARAEDRYREEDISLYDLRRIQVERARYERLLAEAGLDAATARRTLALLIAPEAEELEIGPADSLDQPPPEVATDRVQEAALARRPEVAASEAALRSARASASTMRRERIPDLTATGGLKTQSDGFTGAFLGLSLPLPLWDRRGGAVDASEARVAAAGTRVALVRRQVEHDVRRALDAYRSVDRRADLGTGPSPTDGVGDLLEIAQVAYAEGEMELLDLLDAAEALRETRFAEARLRADLWTAYYDLERAVGGFDDPTNEGDGR